MNYGSSSAFLIILKGPIKMMEIRPQRIFFKKYAKRQQSPLGHVFKFYNYYTIINATFLFICIPLLLLPTVKKNVSKNSPVVRMTDCHNGQTSETDVLVWSRFSLTAVVWSFTIEQQLSLKEKRERKMGHLNLQSLRTGHQPDFTFRPVGQLRNLAPKVRHFGQVHVASQMQAVEN